MLSAMKNDFDDYAESFKTGNPEFDRNINLKKEHTYEVCRWGRLTAESLNLNGHDCVMAEIMALLHDIGRFEQLKRFHTFNDSKSLNHGKLSAEITERLGLLKKVSSHKSRLIKTVVLNHNAMELPSGESRECVFFTKLIRDADKIDILNVVCNFYENCLPEANPMITLNLDMSDEITPWVVEAVLKREKIDMSRLKNINEFKLLQLGWFFDINFEFPQKIIREKKYAQRIMNTMPENPLLKKIKNELMEWGN
jgi:putative nucleotidyltransferase with HDIG domain